MKKTNPIVHTTTKYDYRVIRKDKLTDEEEILFVENFLQRMKVYWKIDDVFMDDFLQGMTIVILSLSFIF